MNTAVVSIREIYAGHVFSIIVTFALDALVIVLCDILFLVKTSIGCSPEADGLKINDVIIVISFLFIKSVDIVFSVLLVWRNLLISISCAFT